MIRRTAPAPTLVTVAHGTRTATGNEVAVRLATAAGTWLGWPATPSYVELCRPLFSEVVATVPGPLVVVPTLLSTGVHVRHDVPEAVAHAGRDDPREVLLGGPLGPHPLLARAQADRLRQAGAEPGQSVVLVAAGSSDPGATAELERAAGLLAQTWGAPVRLATLSGRGHRTAEVVRPGDAVSPYLLATGHFHRVTVRDATAAGAAVVAGVIGPHARVVELIGLRALHLARTARRRPGDRPGPLLVGDRSR